MAAYLFLHYFGSHDDKFDESDIYDVLSSGYDCFKEAYFYIREWIVGDDIDTKELAEITQSFALKVLIFTYQAISWVIQYTCAVLIYIFTNADTMIEAVEYIHPNKDGTIFKTITSLIVYEKPLCFDYNPLHWIVKFFKVLTFNPLFKGNVIAEPENSFFSVDKLLIIGIIVFLALRSYFPNIKKLSIKMFRKLKRNPYYPHYKKHTKGGGHVKNHIDVPNDHFALNLSFNSNLQSINNPPLTNCNNLTVTSNASLCKLVSNILSSSKLVESNALEVESENNSPRNPTEQCLEINDKLTAN